MATYGKTEWVDNSRSNSNKIDYKEKFIKLTDGKRKVMTLVRVVSSLYNYTTHKVFFPGDVGNSATYGRNIRCAGNDCPLCAEGSAAKEQYYMAVIVRKTNELKYVDAKWALKTAILKIKDSPMFEEEETPVKPTECDVKIVADPAQGPTGFYTVHPANKKPLSAQDLQLMDTVDFDTELENMCKPPSPQEVEASVERIKKWIAKNSTTQTSDVSEEKQPVQRSQRAPVVKEEVKEESSEVSDDDFSFRTVKR